MARTILAHMDLTALRVLGDHINATLALTLTAASDSHHHTQLIVYLVQRVTTAQQEQHIDMLTHVLLEPTVLKDPSIPYSALLVTIA